MNKDIEKEVENAEVSDEQLEEAAGGSKLDFIRIPVYLAVCKKCGGEYGSYSSLPEAREAISKMRPKPACSKGGECELTTKKTDNTDIFRF